MGSSCKTGVIIENKKNKSKKHIDKIVRFERKEKTLFPDMPEWEGERYSGIGIKKMKGYKCTIPIDELNILRSEFWNEKYSIDRIWSGIMNACCVEENHARLILKDLGLRAVSGCINHLKDSYSNHYFIPNYCINEPYFEKHLITSESSEISIKIILFDATNNINFPITTSNQTTGQQLKDIYYSKAQIAKNDFNLRLFFSGAEIKDEHHIYQHKLEKNFKVQVMRIPKMTE